jgi:hypothetical protein
MCYVIIHECFYDIIKFWYVLIFLVFEFTYKFLSIIVHFWIIGSQRARLYCLSELLQRLFGFLFIFSVVLFLVNIAICMPIARAFAFSKARLKNHLRSNNYEVCTAAALCFPNILDVMVLQNVNLSEDKLGRPPLCYNFLSLIGCSAYFNRTLIS